MNFSIATTRSLPSGSDVASLLDLVLLAKPGAWNPMSKIENGTVPLPPRSNTLAWPVPNRGDGRTVEERDFNRRKPNCS